MNTVIKVYSKIFSICGLCIALILGTCHSTFSQDQLTTSAFDASNPTYIRSYFKASAESYDFFENATFYSLQLGYYYAIGDKHIAGLSVPFYHNIFAGDYGGYENTTGLGDIRMSYMLNAYTNKVGGPGLQRVSPYLELSAPTGEYLLGRGAGAWLYKP